MQYTLLAAMSQMLAAPSLAQSRFGPPPEAAGELSTHGNQTLGRGSASFAISLHGPQPPPQTTAAIAFLPHGSTAPHDQPLPYAQGGGFPVQDTPPPRGPPPFSAPSSLPLTKPPGQTTSATAYAGDFSLPSTSAAASISSASVDPPLAAAQMSLQLRARTNNRVFGFAGPCPDGPGHPSAQLRPAHTFATGQPHLAINAGPPLNAHAQLGVPQQLLYVYANQDGYAQRTRLDLNLKMKIVMKVQMNCDKCRRKTLRVAARAKGVDSVANEGKDKELVTVIGISVDAVYLVKEMRKKVGYTELVSVGKVKPKVEKTEEKKEGKVVPCCVPPYRPSTCSIM